MDDSLHHSITQRKAELLQAEICQFSIQSHTLKSTLQCVQLFSEFPPNVVNCHHAGINRGQSLFIYFLSTGTHGQRCPQPSSSSVLFMERPCQSGPGGAEEAGDRAGADGSRAGLYSGETVDGAESRAASQLRLRGHQLAAAFRAPWLVSWSVQTHS